MCSTFYEMNYYCSVCLPKQIFRESAKLLWNSISIWLGKRLKQVFSLKKKVSAGSILLASYGLGWDALHYSHGAGTVFRKYKIIWSFDLILCRKQGSGLHREF